MLKRRRRDYLVTVSSGFSRQHVYPYVIPARSRREAASLAEERIGLRGAPWRYRARPARAADYGRAYRIEQEKTR